MDNDRNARLRDQIRKLRTEQPPQPWRQVRIWPIGGLTEVGYAEASDLLLVVSHQGRGVFDCQTGERLARDPESPYDGGAWYDETRLAAMGIGPLEGKLIRVSGLHGGGLPNLTEDGWGLTLVAPMWPDYRVLLSAPFSSIYDDLEHSTQVAADYELRAHGFSETGRSFVVATSSELIVFSR